LKAGVLFYCYKTEQRFFLFDYRLSEEDLSRDYYEAKAIHKGEKFIADIKNATVGKWIKKLKNAKISLSS